MLWPFDERKGNSNRLELQNTCFMNVYKNKKINKNNLLTQFYAFYFPYRV